MPNIVNEILYEELAQSFRDSGSCLVLSFDKLTVAQDGDLRSKLREAGVSYRVVKNRLANRVLKDVMDLDLNESLIGKCGVVFAPEEKAISAAKVVREAMRPLKKEAPVRVVAGIVEGESITGAAADTIADMPDRNTVNAQLAGVIAGPAPRSGIRRK